MPPKMKIFLWMALRDACANKSNLFQCKYASSPLCPVCNDCEETMEHIFLLCPWVFRVWIGGPLSFQINRSSITTLAEWVYVVVNQNLGCKEDIDQSMMYLVFTCWFIWRARCDAVFNGVKPIPCITNWAIITALESFKLASSSMLLSSSV